MPYVNQIVKYLNTQLQAEFTANKFSPSQFVGLAITVKGENGTEPLLADDFDNEKYVGVDDIYSLQVYHKLTSTDHVKDPIQHGGKNNRLITTYQMQMIIAAKRDQIRMTGEELESIFIKGLESKIPNSEIQPLHLSRVSIMPSGTDMNAFTVWRDEYQREFDLRPNQILFRMKYTIEMAYDKSCIESCCN